MELRSEALVLKTVPFREFDQIVTLFTPGHGIATLMVRGSARQRSALSPLMLVDLLAQVGRSDMWKCLEINILFTFSALRQDLDKLEAGAELLKALLETQLKGKAAPLLYRLLVTYMDKLNIEDPRILLASFRLKVLHHEGLLAADIGTPFSAEERPIILLLAYSRSWQELRAIDLDVILEAKIERFFRESVMQ